MKLPNKSYKYNYFYFYKKTIDIYSIESRNYTVITINNNNKEQQMKPTYEWIKENIQVTGLSITTDDNLIGSQFVTMTHESSEVISEINDCLLSNFPAYYDHISYAPCNKGYCLWITVWEDTGEAESFRSKCECYSCGGMFEETEVELVELKSVFLKWKECPDESDYFCDHCLPSKKVIIPSGPVAIGKGETWDGE